jgi:hypothetical protein
MMFSPDSRALSAVFSGAAGFRFDSAVGSSLLTR